MDGGVKMKAHSSICGWHKDWHNCTCGLFSSSDQFAKDIAEMPDEEVKENANKYFLDRQADMKYAIDTETPFTVKAEDYYQAYLIEKEERKRLIKKLEKIDKLSRYAWEQVKRNPQEAEELFKMINAEAK